MIKFIHDPLEAELQLIESGVYRFDPAQNKRIGLKVQINNFINRLIELR